METPNGSMERGNELGGMTNEPAEGSARSMDRSNGSLERPACSPAPRIEILVWPPLSLRDGCS
jgi:hypothetical protein